MAETFIPRSTNIDQATYDGDARILIITFKDGDAWRYRGVDKEVFAAFQRAHSAGSFFYRNIRNRYPAEQV
jgi:hypothetical protein